MSDDLTAWLRAQLDEDERVARAVPDHRQRPGELRWQQVDPNRQPGLIGDDLGNVVTFGIELPLAAHAEHIALHDPARVLREVEAKRALIDRYERQHYHAPAIPGSQYHGTEETGACRTCVTLRLLALPYADRPGYRQDWKP